LNPIQAGEGTLVLCAVVDLSLRRKMEAETQELRRQLAHTGRVSMMGQLASALAHELSQPLGAILRNAEAAEALLQEPTPDLEELRAIVTDIRQDDQRAGQVIDRLRSLLKRRALELQPVDVRDLIGEVVTLVHADAVARHIKVEYSEGAPLPPVLGDRVHLQQVLLNLILNAMDALNGATAGKRGVTIRTRPVEPGWIEVGVSDHGGGISPEAAARLFEPFFTTKAHGMGMGLAVSKTIIEAHGGTLSAENLPEGGALFRFRIPVAPAGNKP
jgi:C4-dicarboxylate-specific signal transduction histidine kinase